MDGSVGEVQLVAVGALGCDTLTPAGVWGSFDACGITPNAIVGVRREFVLGWLAWYHRSTRQVREQVTRVHSDVFIYKLSANQRV